MARVRWNEDNLAEIEATKPVRQKITEPKTPYHPMIDDFDDDDNSSSSIRRRSFGQFFEDEMNAETLPSSVSDDVGSSSKTALQHSGWTSSEEESDPMDQGEEDSDSDTERRRSFREQRKVHYDEFRMVKELRRKGSVLEHESDDESSIAAGVKVIDINKSSEPANGS